MALNVDPNASSGILNAIKGSLGLFSDTNKAQGVTENQNPIPVEEYESSLDAVKIMQLISQWKRTYSVYYTEIERGQQLSFDYWVGKHKNREGTGLNRTGSMDNLIFEAVETFLPIATRSNPEPLVTADPSEPSQQMAKDIKVALSYEADVQKLRRKLAKTTRGWLLNRVGVIKVSWDVKTKAIKTDVVNGKNMIFDKNGYIDESCCFVGEYVGEKKKATAEKLVEMFPKERVKITERAMGKMGTELEYYEWWYHGTDLIYTLDDILLGKFKNPNWNYDGDIEDVDPETAATISVPVQGTNHLKEMTSPYRFLTVFSTGQQPHDDTSLILQNIPAQDKINRREEQIEKNVEGMNNGMVVSGTAFTEEQAAGAASALRRGVAIRVPNGKVSDAIERMAAPALPGDVFNSLRDSRAELRNIFGTSGSTPEGVQKQDTVRGKILVNQMDASRIGGGVTEYIEQLADAIYNLWVQMMFVYYDEEHFITSAGAVGGMELITMKNDRFPLLKTLNITVKEGSLVPKDPLTQRNEAIDLWSAQAIDPLSLYKKLDFPNPQEATNQLILWQMFQQGRIGPEMYLPTFAVAGQTPGQPGQMPPQQGVGGPPVNNIDASQQQPQQQIPTSQEAVGAQSQQLLQQVPV